LDFTDSKHILIFSSEEVSEEAQLRMTSIQDREIDQFKDLSQFLEMETKFTQAYLEILKDLKRNWIDELGVHRPSS
jgi:hypothetical protein